MFSLKENSLNIKILVLIFFTIKCYSQQELKKQHKWFDSKIGQNNTKLYNGYVYKEKFRTIDKSHKFYSSYDFTPIDIIYDGQPFYDVLGKYDTFEDQLIVKLPKNSDFVIIELIRPKLTSFNYKGKIFNKISMQLDSNLVENLFAEKLVENKNTTLYKKHFKERIEKVGDNNITYSSFRPKEKYIIKFNNEYNYIKSKGDLIKLFPNKKKTINKFYAKNKRLFKNNKSSFFTFIVRDVL